MSRVRVICVLVAAILLDIVAGKDLVYVQAIWRHGDRAPEQLPYPADRYTEDYWDRGWEQLTNVGIGQLHELGTFFNDRYVGALINSSFNYKEVYVRATDSSRALASAQSMLSGLFPPTGYDVWKADLKWQPIPIHATTPNEWDPLLRPTDLICPKYDELWEDKYKHPVNDEIKSKYGPVLGILEKTTGYGNDLSIKKAAKLVDITREVAHNMSQPEWVTMQWPEYQNNSTLDIITEMYRLRRIAQFSHPKLALLRGGVITRDFLDRLLNASKGIFNEATKMMLYSSHDGTLLALMYSLGIGDAQLVPYAAALIFELTRDANGLHYVEIYYRTNKQLRLLKIPGCGDTCEVNKFVALFEKNTYESSKVLFDDCGMCDKKNSNCFIAPGTAYVNKPVNNSNYTKISILLTFFVVFVINLF